MTEIVGAIVFLAVILGGAASYKLLPRCVPRFKPNHCHGCGFSLIGIDVRQVCPECGRSREFVPPPRNPWIVVGTTALWAALSFGAGIGMLVWQLGSFVQPFFVALLLPAIAIPCVVSFWIAARGSLLVAHAAGLGMTLVLALLAYLIARELRQDPLAGLAMCMGSVAFPMVMGWGCWVPFTVQSLKARA